MEGVTYQHPESLYTVLRVMLEPDVETPGELFGGRSKAQRLVSAVGKAGTIGVGGRVALRGEWRVHAKHGPQFHFETLEVFPPLGREGIVRYLTSKNFKGIGPVLAERIVATLGPEAFERIEADPECLRGIKGLKKGARAVLVEAVRALRAERAVASFLYGLELNSAQVVEATRVLGERPRRRYGATPTSWRGTCAGSVFRAPTAPRRSSDSRRTRPSGVGQRWCSRWKKRRTRGTRASSSRVCGNGRGRCSDRNSRPSSSSTT